MTQARQVSGAAGEQRLEPVGATLVGLRAIAEFKVRLMEQRSAVGDARLHRSMSTFGVRESRTEESAA